MNTVLLLPAFILSCFIVATCQPAVAQEQLVLHSVSDIHKLPPEQLPDRVPVDMECIVAYYAKDWPITFFHDGVAGIYAGGPRDLNVKTGDRVRVRGVVGPARFLIDYTVELSPNSLVLPAPKVTKFERLEDGMDDSQLVQITGQLVSLQTDTHHTVLEMNATAGGRFRALLHKSAASIADLRPLLGRQIRIHGLSGARFNESGTFIGSQIWITSRSDVEAIRPEEFSDIVPVTAIAALSEVPRIPGAASFFRVRARVDYHISANMILVHDETGTLFVETPTATKAGIGECFEIGGVLDAGMVPPILRFAELVQTSQDISQTPAAVAMSISELVAGKFSGQIVSTRGEFVGPFSIGREHGFLLQADQQLLPVFLRDNQLADVTSGTSVEVTGVWVQQRSLTGFNIGSCALYSRLDGIVVGSQFPWKLVTILTLAALVAMISLVWAVTLRRQVQIQTKRVLDVYANQRLMEQHYADIFINAQVMVVTADAAGRITAANPATVRITGRDEKSLIGSLLRDLVHPNNADDVDRMLQKALRSTESSSRDVQVGTESGVLIPQEVSCWCSQDENNTIVHTIWHDISHRLQMEQEKRQFEHEMMYAQKMESLGVLAGGIAHDFNNLLTVILGNASLIQHSPASTTSDIECVRYIQMGATRAAELTQQMLAYAGRGTLEVRDLNVSALITEMSSLLMASVPKSTQLSFDLPTDLPAVRADATQLRQILMNLVLNGSEALDGEPGTVEISTAVLECSPDELSDCAVNFSEAGRTFVQLRVTDPGTGIDGETLKRIFDPFFSTKFSGRGLGLSTVLGIVRAHEGCIRVLTGPNAGTQFEILLPASAEPANPIPDIIHRMSQEYGTGNVLVVDDESSVRELMCRTLEHAGLVATAAASGAEAIALFTREGNRFDCVITDMTMPGMCGDELTELLRHIQPDIPVILCSGYNVHEPESAIVSGAPTAFLKKPFSTRQLTSLAHRLVSRTPARTS